MLYGQNSQCLRISTLRLTGVKPKLFFPKNSFQCFMEVALNVPPILWKHFVSLMLNPLKLRLTWISLWLSKLSS